MTPEHRNKLVVSTPSDLVIELVRVFDAPRELVWRAMTEAELLAKWWGQRNSITIVDQLDLRPGGTWRFVQRTPEGTEYGFRGEFREILPPERLVWTFEFEPMLGHLVVDTLTLEDLDERTRLRSISRFDSVEDRNGMINSGMEAGAAESYDRLEELLSSTATNVT